MGVGICTPMLFLLVCSMGVSLLDAEQLISGACSVLSGEFTVQTMGQTFKPGTPAEPGQGCGVGYTCVTRQVALVFNLTFPGECEDDDVGLLNSAEKAGVGGRVTSCADAALKGYCTEADNNIGNKVTMFCCQSCNGNEIKNIGAPTLPPTQQPLPSDCTDDDGALTTISNGAVSF